MAETANTADSRLSSEKPSNICKYFWKRKRSFCSINKITVPQAQPLTENSSAQFPVVLSDTKDAILITDVRFNYLLRARKKNQSASEDLRTLSRSPNERSTTNEMCGTSVILLPSSSSPLLFALLNSYCTQATFTSILSTDLEQHHALAHCKFEEIHTHSYSNENMQTITVMPQINFPKPGLTCCAAKFALLKLFSGSSSDTSLYNLIFLFAAVP
ncbi:unnamed protein product [Hymenolepis diminuta]|uniref:Uncharacterized protein n=1 Tax=Hymenolepis diminuta TaxID=6216 RepID=A0A564Y716_HYMDI|nr:unnamed protein product [Hymenolepis diminuta]